MTRPLPLPAVTIVIAFALATTARADWPSFRGPNHTGAVTGAGLANYAGTPTRAWSTNVGVGAGSVAVAEGKLVVLGNRDDHEVLTCLDATTGEALWAYRYPVKFSKRSFSGGSATTPAIDDGLVYVLSEAGPIHCVKLADGSKVWQSHADRFGGKLPRWHYASSPIVVGDAVIFSIGGDGNSTLALNKKTGAKLWGTGSQGATYGSPVAFTLKGKAFVAVAKQKSYVVLDAATGRQIASIPWTTSYDVNSGTPTFVDGKLVITNGYGKGKAAAFDLNRGAQKLWENGDFAAKYCSPVVFDGHLYGIAGERRGAMTCIRLSDGKTVWADGRYGNGTLIIADGQIVALSEGGKLVIGKASPSGFKPTVEMAVVAGRAWVEPVVAGGMVYAKNNAGELVAMKLK